MQDQTIVRYIERFHRRGSDVAYVHRRGYRVERWSYLDVARAAASFASLLEERHVGKGDKVLLWGENCAEWVVTFLGCVLRGVVVVPMDRIGSPAFTHTVAGQVDARLCICSRALRESAPDVPLLLLEDLKDAVQQRSSVFRTPVDLNCSDPVEIVFTSGTTAEPKGVVITHRNILANLEPLDREIAKYLKYERIFHPLRFLNLLPLSHVFGQFLGIFIPQLLGATVIFQESLNPSEIVRNIKRERVSVLVAVPRLLDTLRDKMRRDLELSGELEEFERSFRDSDGEHFAKRWWRFRRIHRLFGWKFWAFICGGAALDPATETFWSRLSFVVVQGYGLTETTSLVSVNHPFKLGRGSIGQVLPGREVRLDETGEILVRGENIAAAYSQGKELSRVNGQEGWFHTGDIGELDAKGNLYFKGRKKNVIVTAEGMNIYPEDLEAVLRRQSGVRDCVVVGLEREKNAEPCAVLLLEGDGPDAEQVIGLANESLAEYQNIRRWMVWPEEDFPRTSTQKPRISLIQGEVAARFAGETGVAGLEPGSLADLIGRITRRPVSRLSADTSLADDLNLSSLERVELLSALEDRFQTDLNESKFTSAMTVGELEQMLRQPVAKRSDYRYPRWAQRLPVHVIRVLVYYLLSWPATLLMTRPLVRGRENLAGLRGPLLIVANHITQVDIGFVMIALPPRIRHRLAVAMLGEMLQGMRNPPPEMSWYRRAMEQLSYFLVVALFNVFPLPQQTGFRESFAFAGESADRGYSIVVFPEGRRTQDGMLSPFRSGIGMLARNLDLPVLTIRIDGLFELKQKARKLARPGTVKVSVGSPRRFPPGSDPEWITRELETEMAALKAL
jgi:long-chain acyl-CoA synthetase